MSFADLLNEEMKKRGLKQKDICRFTGIKSVTLSEYCRGVREPKPEIKAKIAEALNLPSDYFGDDPKTEQDGMIERLSVEEAARIMGMAAQTIREGLKDRRFPWGYAVQVASGGWVYWINKAKFYNHEMIR